MPIFLLVSGVGALIGAAGTIIVGNSLDEVNETVTNTADGFAKVAQWATIAGGLYLIAKYKKLV